MRRPCTLWARVAAGALALLFAPDCAVRGDGAADTGGAGGAPETGSGDALNTPDGVVLSAAVWTLAWDTSGAEFPEAGGLEVETDLGYRVHVDDGRILSHSVSFGPCDAATQARSDGPAGLFGGPATEGQAPGARATGGLGWAWRLVASGLSVRAAAAHTSDTDPSMIEASLVEDLTSPRETEVSTGFAASRYCRAHWLLARPMSPTSGPDDVEMANRSLYVTGTYERDGKVEPFVIDTWWPEGNLQDLAGVLGEEAFSAARADGGARHAFVTVRRSLGTLFDGIDFEVASKDQVAGRTIDNLAGSVRFEGVLWSP